MKHTLWIVAVSGLSFAGACASAPDAAQTTPASEAAARGELDPVGSYTFSTIIQGMAVDGQLRITGTRDAWGGTIYTPATGELPVSAVEVDGQEVRVTTDTPDGIVHVRMMFSGDAFTGDWSLGAEGGAVRGRRIGR